MCITFLFSLASFSWAKAKDTAMNREIRAVKYFMSTSKVFQ